VTNSGWGLYLLGTSVSGHNSLPQVRGNDLMGNTSYDLIAQSYFQPTNVVVIDARSNWWGTGRRHPDRGKSLRLYGQPEQLAGGELRELAQFARRASGGGNFFEWTDCQ